MDRVGPERLITDFVNRRVWAVVGVSQDPLKFGNRVFRSLLRAGYTVYAVHPKGGEIEGVRIHVSLADLPQPPEVVDTVVPPVVTEQIVKEMHELGLKRVWMQPGSESEAAIAYCEQQDMQVVTRACAMVRQRTWE